MKEVFCDIAVVGAGPAGLAAAAAALKSGAENVILVEQQAEIPVEKNRRSVTRRRHAGCGSEHSFQEGAEETAYTCWWATTAMQIRGKSLLCINRKEILKIHFSALILAMGCKATVQEVPLCTSNVPAGFYRAEKLPRQGPGDRKGVLILGSGDDSMQLARRMAQKGAHVRGLVEPLPEMIGSAANKERCLDPFQIPLFLSHAVADVRGTNQVESVTLAPVGSGHRLQLEQAFVVPCDTLVYSPKELSRSVDVVLSEIHCGIKVNRFKQTQIPWIFACGDLIQPYEEEYRIAREGETAARYAVMYAKRGLPDV